MAVDLRWRDACSESRAFTQAEIDGGWPESMTTGKLAAIQRPYPSGNAAGSRACRALASTLDVACEDGSLVHESSQHIKLTMRVDHVPNRFSDNALWPSAYVRDGAAYAYSTGGDEYTVTRRRVRPKDFAAWLHTQGEAPSKHASAWFEVRGVAWPLAVNAAASASAGEPVVVDAGDVKDLESLARYRGRFTHLPAQQRPEWLPEHVAIVRTAVEERGRGGAGKVADKLGMSVQGVRDLLKRHALPKANPFPTAKRA